MQRLRHFINRAGSALLRRQPTLPDQQTAVYVSSSAVALAHIKLPAGATAAGAGVNMRADAIQQLQEIPDILAEQAFSLGVRSAASSQHCNLVLAPEMYNVNLLERPDVDAADLRDAARWAIQDQVEYAVDDAVIDTFDLPKSASRERPMIFVVSAQAGLLQSLLTRIRSAGLDVASIDVAELALRNLVWRCFPGADQSVAMLRLTANSGMISISRGDELYLSRRISGVPGVFAEETWQDFRERMLLQVQRSIDYYESAMGQPHCNVLMVACTHDWSDKVCAYLGEMLAIPVREVSPLLHELHDEINLVLFNPQRENIDWTAMTPAQVNAFAAALPALGGVLRTSIEQATNPQIMPAVASEVA